MLHDLTVKFIYCVTFRVAIIDDSIKVVKLAVLVFSVEAGEVIGCHQVRSEGLARESDLARGGWRDAHYIGRVVHGAEDRKQAIFIFQHA